MSPAGNRREMRRKSKSSFRLIQVLLISVSVFFIFVVSLSVTYGLKELRSEKMSRNDLIFDPDEYFFNRATVLTISVMTITSLILGIVAVISSSFCLLLFSGTSGTAIFLTQILVLTIENVITPFTALIFGSMVAAYGGAIIYLAHKMNKYKYYHRTLGTRATQLMEPSIVRKIPSRTPSTTASSSTINSYMILNETGFNSLSSFSDRDELCSKEIPCASVDIGLVKTHK